MKKIMLSTMLIISILLLTSCSNSQASLKISDIKVNTILVNKDGTVQAGIVEEFDEKYYKEEELKSFVDEQIEEYNKLAGKGSVVVNSFEIKNKKAKAVLTYADIEDYMKLNEVEAYFMTAKEARENQLIPDTFMEAKDGKTVEKDKALENNNYKVLIITEPCDIMVYKKVLYYSNAVLLNSKSVQSSDNNYSVVVFKK